MTEHGWIVPMWAYVAATVLLPFWFRAVSAVADDPGAFYSRSRTGSLLHGAVWMATLLDRNHLGETALLAIFAINMFGTLFYVMCMRRDPAPDD